MDSVSVIGLITNDVVGERMAGPGIRYWEFARILSAYFPVKLIVPPFVAMESMPMADSPVALHICKNTRDLQIAVQECEIIVTLGVVLILYPFIVELEKPLVIDIYDPFILENLQREAGSDLLKRITTHENMLEALRVQLWAGDFFICAGEKQRDYWLGVLSAMGRINPFSYQEDSTLRNLIDVVPFGIPESPPEHTQAVLKGIYKNIKANDKVILWGGGIWSWFDASTLIKAMALIGQQRDDVKLFFMGIKRPNNDSGKMNIVNQVITLSKDLGLYNQTVFFNDWVPYNQRQNYLLEADIGVSLHLDHIETRFSFRTRLLDYLWAGLPTICTEGDVLGEMLAAHKVAYLVAPGDVEGVARAVVTLLDDPVTQEELTSCFEQVSVQYHWEKVTQPLIRFCTNPQFAPDKSYLRQKHSFVLQQFSGGKRLGLVAKSWRALRLGGVTGFLQQTKAYIRWKMSNSQQK